MNELLARTTGFRWRSTCRQRSAVAAGIGFLLLGCGAAITSSGASPIADTDHDGIVDAKDVCPLVPEDHDGDDDDDGCPEAKEPDTDEDGILDTMDACPEVAEDRDGVEDQDGCPEP
jgi:hypothetical protein